MSMTIDAGSYGAKTQTIYSGNPRALLKQLLDENPSAQHGELLEAMLVKLGAPEASEDLRGVVSYWLTNNRRAVLLEEGAPPKPPSLATLAARNEERKAAVEALKATIKVNAVQMVLLDFPLPGGIKLRDATTRDCAKVGGWLIDVAAKVPRGKCVGDVLSEEALQKIFKTRMEQNP